MRIAIMSDLHLEFTRKMNSLTWLVEHDRIQLYVGFTLPHDVDADVLVIAGDIHPDEKVRDDFLNKLAKHYGAMPVLHVTGNHDFYHGVFPHMEKPRVVEVDGVRFGLATLWTQPHDTADAYKMRMNDFHLIKFEGGNDIKQWEDTHRYHADYLFEVDPDVVVTHHLPSYRSVPMNFVGDPLNQFYATCLDDRIEEMKSCKLWIHGHTHVDQDYHINNVRVVCAPVGYPHERGRPPLPEWKVVEI